MNNARRQRPLDHGRGIALIAVLWIVAALSLIVTGLVKVTRQDAKVVAASKQGVIAEALGSAAIQIVLQKMQTQREAFNRYQTVPVNFEGANVTVAITPMTGLVNVNGASPQLLAQVFRVAGGLPAGVATGLAQQVVAVRDKPDGQGLVVGFDAPEDLLQVPGVDYELYANISSLLVADKRGSGKVNAQAAPPDVLVVLAGGNQQAAQNMAQARQSQGAMADMTALDASFLDNAVNNRFRLQAFLTVDGGRQWSVSRDVDLVSTSRDGLPWRVIGADRRLLPAG